MTRGQRIDAPGMLHHVHNRGARRQAIFFDDRDRRSFLWLLGDAVAKHAGVVHAFCLMGNHYHLLVGTEDGEVDRLMQSATARYVRRFNYRHGLDGPMFADRYKNHPVLEETYLPAAVRYIHRNPLDIAGADIVTYRWSSLRCYADRALAPVWLTTGRILKSTGGNRRAYVDYVTRDVNRSTVHEGSKDDEPLHTAQSDPRALLDDVLTITEQLMFCERHQLLQTGDRRRNVPRLLACHIAVREAALPVALVAHALGFATTSGLWKALKRFEALADDNPVLTALAQQSWHLIPTAEAA
jgi:REP element-mobilizing transposase RayT